MSAKKHMAIVYMTKNHIDSVIYETDNSDFESALDVLRSCFYTRKNFKFVSKHVASDYYNFTYNVSGKDVRVSVEFMPIKKVKKECGSIINIDKKK